jgi:tryptophanyl-tRNA synthetase
MCIEGIDPKISKIFVQSHVSAHAELAWMLGCITPQGWLHRMTQYKDKVKKHQNSIELAGLGIYSYPVLMAADILLYQTDAVPVGDDQLQHLELARDICKTFHHKFCLNGERVFKSPKAMVVEQGSRVMSLQDGRSKMSKSHHDDMSRINILDEPDVIAAKIKKCKTDSESGIEYANNNRPECTNLVQIYQVITGKSKIEIEHEIVGLKWGQFKPLLTEAIIEQLSPIRLKYRDIISDPSYLESVLSNGSEIASSIANDTLLKAKSAMGFVIPRVKK